MKIEFYHIDAFEVPNYEPIWRALREMGVEANLVGVPDETNTAAGDWFDFDRFKGYCEEHALPFNTKPDPSADIAITTQNIDILSDYHNTKVRLMYGPTVYPPAWGLQPHTVKPFDAVLTHGQYYVDFFSQWVPAEQLPIVGYPRYDDFFAGKLSRKLIRARWGIHDDKPILVFLPTWGDNTGFDLFISALLLLKEQYHIILRPHHCTLRFETARMALMKASGLLILENAFELSEIFSGADVILSDTRSGALYEACVCNIPTVGMVLDPANEISWLLAAGIDKISTLCSNPNNLAAAIDIALTSPEQAQHKKRWAEQRVSYQDGSAAKRAALELINLAIAAKKRQTSSVNSNAENQ